MIAFSKISSLQSGISVGRSNIKTVAERRLPEVRKFIHTLLNSSNEMINSDLVITFFHPLLRDQQEADIHVTKMREDKGNSENDRNIGGEIKLSIHYHRETFIVMVKSYWLIFVYYLIYRFIQKPFSDTSRKSDSTDDWRTRTKHLC